MAGRFLGSIYTYPWDLADEGLEQSLPRIADTGCQEVMLAAAYHVSTYFLPHNPRRPIYWGEDGAIYFQPDWPRFQRAGLRPLVSRVVTRSDYFDRIVEAIRRQGLQFSAWIVYLYNHHLAENYPELARKDAFGNPYLGQLSCGPRQVQDYAIALTQNVLERFQPAAVHVESLHRMGWDYGFRNPKVLSPIAPRCQFLLGVDFNESMMEPSGQEGRRLRADAVAWLRPRLARLPVEEDNEPVTAEWVGRAFDGRLAAYLAECRKRTTGLWETIAKMIHQAGAKVQSGIATAASELRTDLAATSNVMLDRVTAGVTITREEAAGIRGRIAREGMVLASTQPGGMTNEGPLIHQVRGAREAGCGGCTFYNYGLLRQEQLAFIRRALDSL